MLMNVYSHYVLFEDRMCVYTEREVFVARLCYTGKFEDLNRETGNSKGFTLFVCFSHQHIFC